MAAPADAGMDLAIGQVCEAAHGLLTAVDKLVGHYKTEGVAV